MLWDQKEEFELGARVGRVRSRRSRSLTGEATWSRVQAGRIAGVGDARRRGRKGDMPSDTDAATTPGTDFFLLLGFFFLWFFVGLSPRVKKKVIQASPDSGEKDIRPNNNVSPLKKKRGEAKFPAQPTSTSFPAIPLIHPAAHEPALLHQEDGCASPPTPPPRPRRAAHWFRSRR